MKLMFRERIWPFCCSLKLAIWLASAATLVAAGGSLTLPYSPRIFGDLDLMPLGDWLRAGLERSPQLTWWLPLAALLTVLLGLNTLCCFLDWLTGLRRRWRKGGEYLIHLGFVLVLAAFCWESLSGFRAPDLRLAVGETLAVPRQPGRYLRLDRLEPVFSAGRPVDIRASVTLLQGDELLEQAEVRFNHPLTRDGLIVLVESFGRRAEGFRFLLADQGMVTLKEGSFLPLGNGSRLEIVRFVPHAVRLGPDTVRNGSDEPLRPALEFRLVSPTGEIRQGWYFLTEGLPAELAGSGVLLRPLEPVYDVYGILKVNYDPGAGLALAGGGTMLLGTVIAFFSFYAKRRRGDRPEVI